MRIPWFWKKIWHGSISGNICLIEVSNPAKFGAFIKKRTILSLNSWTIGPFQTPLHSCSEPNWWVKYGRRAGFESVWFGRLSLVRQTTLNSAGSVSLCDVGAAADSYGVHNCTGPQMIAGPQMILGSFADPYSLTPTWILTFQRVLQWHQKQAR